VSARLIDAKAAGELLGVPHTWVLEQARHDRIPHIRLGRYRRFDPEQLLAWAQKRARGPIYTSQNATTVAPARRQPPGA
jgi:excisionase family DNA binding protein